MKVLLYITLIIFFVCCKTKNNNQFGIDDLINIYENQSASTMYHFKQLESKEKETNFEKITNNKKEQLKFIIENSRKVLIYYCNSEIDILSMSNEHVRDISFLPMVQQNFIYKNYKIDFGDTIYIKENFKHIVLTKQIP